MLTENILDPSGSIIASKRFDQYDGYYFYDYDYRGSTTAIIAPNGTLVKAYTYNEYGKMQETTQSTFNNEVTFTSSVTDESTGLQYMNSRFYNPSTGRFLSQDTYSGNAYEPWTQHLYSYAGNNPVNFIDPTGHATQVTYFDGKVSHTIVVPNPEQGDKKFKPYDPAVKAKKQKALKDAINGVNKDSNEGKILNEALNNMENYFIGYAEVPIDGQVDLHNKLLSPLINIEKANKLAQDISATISGFVPVPDVVGIGRSISDGASALVGAVDDYLKNEHEIDPDAIVYPGTYDIYKFRSSESQYSPNVGGYFATRTTADYDYTILLGTGAETVGKMYIWTTELYAVNGLAVPVQVDYMSVGVTHGTSTIGEY